MADHRLTIRFRFDFSDMVQQLREAADMLEALDPQAEPEPPADSQADPDLTGPADRTG